MNLAETAWLISCVMNVWAINSLCVSISQRTVKNCWAFLNLQRWMNTFAEFIASSVLTAIMTYANWRLSAEMSLFSKKKKMGERGVTACITKIEGRTIRVCACHCFYLMCGIRWAFVAMELNQYLSLWRSAWRGYLKIKEILHRYRVCTVAVELYVKGTWAPTVTWCLVRSHSDLLCEGRDETVTKEQILRQVGTSRDAVQTLYFSGI